MATSESAFNEGSAAELSKELELIKHEEQTLLRIKEIIKQQLESLKREESSLKQKIVLEQNKLGLISSEKRRAVGIEELEMNESDTLKIDETRNNPNKLPSSSMDLSSLPVESCGRRAQIDQQSSITSELSALYLYENQKMPTYDFQSEDYANLEPLKALTPEDLQMLGLPQSEENEAETTEEIDKYWSYQVPSGAPMANGTQMASYLPTENAMPELTMEDLNPSDSFNFASSNVECEEEEEDDEELDAELNVKFL